jgi:MFS family permease
MFGCFIGGRFGDKFGRRRAVVLGSMFTPLGGALASWVTELEHDDLCPCHLWYRHWIHQLSEYRQRNDGVASTLTLNQIIPAWVSELAKAHNRGSAFALVFCANYVGIVIAYWLRYGLRKHKSAFQWRFPLVFQVVPVVILLITVGFLPESPRWLIANGRREEAVEILAKIRGDVPLSDLALTAELEPLDAIVVAAGHKRYRFHNVAFGRYSGRLHLGRRVGLAIGMMIMMMMMEWTGILAITVYANTLFQQAGFSADKASWLSGLCNTFGIVGTAASVLTVDRFGCLKSLYFGFFIQGAVLLLSGGLSRLGELHPGNAAAYGAASAAFVLVYTFFFAQTVLMISFIYPTEIWPQEIRALGNSFGVFGWAVGCGTTTLVIPSMFSTLGWKTLIVFWCVQLLLLTAGVLLLPGDEGQESGRDQPAFLVEQSTGKRERKGIQKDVG